MTPLNSVFLLSLPSSLSSLTYRLIADSLPLRRPRWVTAGEILNTDRYLFNRVTRGWSYAFTERGRAWTSRKWLHPEKDSQRFQGALRFLTGVVEPEGMVYKDAINPFVVANWLEANPGPEVVVIDRDVVGVAQKMLRKHWLYPARLSEHEDIERALLDGLTRAQKRLRELDGAHVLPFSDLIQSEQPLNHLLESWGGERVSYIDGAFKRKRTQERKLRERPRYDRLKVYYRQMAT